MDAHGIDISPDQIERSRAFCQQTGLPIQLAVADMRSLPFEEASFDYVHEHYSMCHLNKADTATAVAEMHRVLKLSGVSHPSVSYRRIAGRCHRTGRSSHRVSAG